MPRAAKSAAKPAVVTRPVILDRKVIAAASKYAENKAEVARIESENEALKPQLLEAMGDHESVSAGNRVLTRSEVAAISPTRNVVITKTMIGQVIPGKKGRKGYIQLSVQ